MAVRAIKVLPTRYNGIRFRSRTEARWAVFLDALGARWEYEPEGYDLDGIPYLPDFLIRDWGIFLEVKGIAPTPDEVEKCCRLAEATQLHVLLVIGDPGRQDGRLFEHGTEKSRREVMAFFARCRRCDRLTISYSHNDDEAYGDFPVDGPCGRPNACDRPAPFGNELDDAIQAALDHRFDRKKKAA